MLLAVASLVAATDQQRRVRAAYALVFAIAPVLAVWLISRGPFSYWMFRYMLFAVFGWALGAGLCIAYVAERVTGLLAKRATGTRVTGARGLSPRFAVAAVLVVVVGLVGLHDQFGVRANEAHNLWAYPEQPSNGTPADYQGAAAVVAANEEPGDWIAFQTSDDNHYQVNTAMEYYLRGKLPQVAFQAADEVQANSLQPTSCKDPVPCITGTPRLWVVYVDHLVPTNPAPSPYPAPFSSAVLGQNLAGSNLEVSGYHVQRTWEEDGVSVALLAP
jgi:mannosyltransferase